jgi:hypothetical protein
MIGAGKENGRFRTVLQTGPADIPMSEVRRCGRRADAKNMGIGWISRRNMAYQDLIAFRAATDIRNFKGLRDGGAATVAGYGQADLFGAGTV